MLGAALAFFNSNFFAALLGAIVGGFLSIWATDRFQHRQELKERRAVALALTHRLIAAGNELGSLLKPLLAAIKGKDGKLIPEEDFWKFVRPLAGIPTDTLGYDVREIGLLHLEEHNELTMHIIDVVNARDVAVSLMQTFNEMRNGIDDELSRSAKFQGAGEKLFIQAAMNPAEHSQLLGRIHKANSLLVQLVPMLRESYDLARQTADQLSAALPRYFPKRTPLKKIAFPVIN